MKSSKWTETKKECEVDTEGNLTTKRITLEVSKRKYWGLEKKDIIDTILRFVGLAAIFLPLWLFYQQQSAERTKQKTLFQMDVYSTTVTQLHSLLNAPLCSHEFENTKNSLLFEMYPKLILLSDKAVIDTFTSVKTLLEFSSILCKGFNLADSLYEMTSKIEEAISNRTKSRDIVIGKHNKEFYNVYRQIYYLLPRLDNLDHKSNTEYDSTKNLKLFDQAFVHTILDLKMKANAYSDSFTKFEDGSLNDFKLDNIEFYDLQYDIAKLKDEYTEYYYQQLNVLIPKFDSIIINSSILSTSE